MNIYINQAFYKFIMTILDGFFWLRMVKHISTKIEWRPNSGWKLFSYVHFPKYLLEQSMDQIA